jgi:hypothetical protein
MRVGKKVLDAAPLMLAERFMLTTALALAAVNLAAIVWRAIPVVWFEYVAASLFTGAILALGLFYRYAGRGDHLANTLIATASFLLFTIAASAFTYQLLPIWRAPIDPWLMSIDRMLGFHWPDLLAFAADRPWLAETTRYAYMSSFVQFTLLVLVLGFSNRTHELHVFMLATVTTTLTTIAVWGLFPSFGTTTVYAIDADVEARLRPIVGSSYGLELLRRAAEGPVRISAQDSLGLVAAPSYHTVMALLAIYAARTIPYLRVGALALNLMILPGILIHGGHHLVDIFAGAIVTVIGILTAQAMLRSPRTLHPAAVSSAP